MRKSKGQFLTDHERMLAVKSGDIDQLGRLFEKFHQKLYNFFLHQTGSRQSSEDLAQDVFFRMLKYRHTYRGEGKFTTWMFTIAHNTKIDYYRKSNNLPQLNDKLDATEGHELDPEEELNSAADIVLLRKALAQLPQDKREVLLLSRFQDLKYEEIAKVLNCKVGTVKARVFRALKELSKIYFKLAGEKL